MVAPLKTVVLKRPREAFRSQEAIESQWRGLGYLDPPDLDRAEEGHRQFVSLIQAAGANVLYLPESQATGLDSIYTHDPVLITDRGAVVLNPGKKARREEGQAFAAALEDWGVPILGTIEDEAKAEGGDMLWLDSSTLAVGLSFRTNAAGVKALTAFLKPSNISVVSFQLPYFGGPSQVLHLQSFISMIDYDLVLVYRRLLPIPLFEILENRGFRFVDVPDEEYDSLGANVLALAPRETIMISGNPKTQARIEARGCNVSVFDGRQICLSGSGGPTCLTRALLRERA